MHYQSLYFIFLISGLCISFWTILSWLGSFIFLFFLVSFLYGGETVPKSGCSCYWQVGRSKHKSSKKWLVQGLMFWIFISWIYILQVNDSIGMLNYGIGVGCGWLTPGRDKILKVRSVTNPVFYNLGNRRGNRLWLLY